MSERKTRSDHEFIVPAEAKLFSLIRQIESLNRQLSMLAEWQTEPLKERLRLKEKELEELTDDWDAFIAQCSQHYAKRAYKTMLRLTIEAANLISLKQLSRNFVTTVGNLFVRVLGKADRNTDKRSLVVHPPGMSMLKLARVICSDKHIKEQFEPAVADWQSEYFDALESNASRPKMFFVRLRNTWALLKLFGIVSWLSMIGKFITRMLSQK